MAKNKECQDIMLGFKHDEKFTYDKKGDKLLERADLSLSKLKGYKGAEDVNLYSFDSCQIDMKQIKRFRYKLVKWLPDSNPARKNMYFKNVPIN